MKKVVNEWVFHQYLIAIFITFKYQYNFIQIEGENECDLCEISGKVPNACRVVSRSSLIKVSTFFFATVKGMEEGRIMNVG